MSVYPSHLITTALHRGEARRTERMSSAADSASRPQRSLRRVTAWLAAFALAAAFYLLLIDTVDLPELVVAVVAAGLAATGFELAREQQTVGGLRARLAWTARIHRPLTNVPRDIAVLSQSAIRQLIHPQPVNGAFRAVPFRCGPGQELETGRAALAESFGSFSPNTIVIGVDVERDVILGHQLRPGGGRASIDILGLGEADGDEGPKP